MRASGCALSALVLFLCCVFPAMPDKARAGGSDAAQASLLAWEGKYPFDEGKDFFDDPAVAEAAKKNISATLVKSLRELSVNSPFERNGDILFAQVCKPHDCPSAFATIYLDTKKRTIQLCMSKYDPKMRQNKDSWVGKTIRRLPEGSCTRDMKAFTAFGDPD